ncbi:hypothetical protein EC991_005034 [Linnemannia zychae]|nr:hypothetical protein EC991_005034 [Linnemannia zychae]
MPERGGVSGGVGVSGSDRIIDTHNRTLGGWQLEGGSVSRSNSHSNGGLFAAGGGSSDGPAGFKRREFDPRSSSSNNTNNNSTVDPEFFPPTSQMEPSSSIQSLVESIDDDHVFKLTEMTKKRVEQNNPAAQKRQRVVSLSTNDPSTALQFMPSEKSLQLSNICKSTLEAHYSELFRSIKAGHPINRLQKLREVLPRVKSTSMVPKSGGFDGKNSMDAGHSRPKKSKHDKYRFVDKVEESNCIWDVDRMEAKAKDAEAAEAAEAAALYRSTTLGSHHNNSSHSSQQHLHRITNELSQDSLQQHLSSTSMESFGVEHSTSGDSYGPPIMSDIQHMQQLQHQKDNLDEVVKEHSNNPSGSSPISTISSATNPSYAHGSSYSSLEPIPVAQAKDIPLDARPRFLDGVATGPPAQSAMPAQVSSMSDVYNAFGSSLEQPYAEIPSSKRNSFLGIFGMRGKKGGQDTDIHHHQESQPTSSYGSPLLTATAPIHERRSFDSQHSPFLQPALPPPQGQRYAPTVEVIPPSLINSPSGNVAQVRPDPKRRVSVDQSMARVADPNDPNIMLTDDEAISHWVPPTQWAEGERLDESQDESDSVANAAQKRSSLRRFTDKMMRKRGHKTLSVIQQGESPINSPTSPAGKPLFSDGNKSLGKKLDPALAHLQGQPSGRMSSSQPSSGRNSLDGIQRPKMSNVRVMSSTSSPILEAIRTPDGVNASSPRVGPLPNAHEFASRFDKANNALNPIRAEKTPTLNPAAKTDRSPLLNATRVDKSPNLAPVSGFSGDDIAGNGHNPDGTPAVPVAPQLFIESDRIPKRMLQRLKQRPDLATVDWGSETIDLSALLTSQEPLPTYDEYLGISSAMKKSHLYPSHLSDVDVLDIHLTLGAEERRDVDAKNRARKWDMLELRLDQEQDVSEKWIKEVVAWSKKKYDSIDRHRRAENPDAFWPISGDSPLVEEPEQEAPGEEDESQAFMRVSDAAKNHRTAPTRTPHIASLETLKARKQQRDLSLTSTREMNGSISSIHASVTTTFKASLESTRESVKEMRVMLADCRQRLQQLHEATGAQLREKEPIFKEVVDKFTAEWNESYFVKLKEVEDQIQVMNLKRIENPWMDMLLIMLSWVIRGLFYIVEGVTILIIIVRHMWSRAKQGFGMVRDARKDYELANTSGLLRAGSSASNGSSAVGEVAKDEGIEGREQADSEASRPPAKVVGAW